MQALTTSKLNYFCPLVPVGGMYNNLKIKIDCILKQNISLRIIDKSHGKKSLFIHHKVNDLVLKYF